MKSHLNLDQKAYLISD